MKKVNWTARWIAPAVHMGPVCPEFCRSFSLEKPVAKAMLHVTAGGTYEATLNGSRISDYVLAPGWTSFRHRLQYQSYDVTEMLSGENDLRILVGHGWYSSRRFSHWIPGRSWPSAALENLACIAQLELEYTDGTQELLVTDESWSCRESMVRFTDIYDGETADARCGNGEVLPVSLAEESMEKLVPQEGEIICEQDRVKPRRIFRTPKGELVVDFGQEVTGYVEFTVNAKAGDEIEISHGEVLDADGNFYNANYRSAKAKLCYTCKDGLQTYKPKLTFFGFRFIRLDKFPGEPDKNDFTAVLVSSNLKRTGHIRCGDARINRLFENVIWGQRTNFLDVPTDCPQRDERMGWTGDAQVFSKTACYNFDCDKFYRKWLSDLALDQRPDGSVPIVIPMIDEENLSTSAAWADAAVIIPWDMYLTYGDKDILARQYDSMVKHLDYIAAVSPEPYQWVGGSRFGDWLGLDAPSGSYKGSTREDFVASAYYAYDVALMIRISEILGKDAEKYRTLHENIVRTFREIYPTYETQTECVLALHFGLTPDPEATAAQLAKMVEDAGKSLKTGFVGTPYLLYTLSRNGYQEQAYDLLLRQEYPGWLYSVGKGATTIWEHWDGIKEDGGFWSTDMNSFNHYAYGSVMGWVYEEAAGIHTVEEAPGFEKIRIAPHPDKRMGWLEASIDTPKGPVFSGWYYELEGLRYEIHTPVPAVLELEGRTVELEPGSHLFFAE